MLFFLVIMNVVIWSQVRFSHRLWNKWLTEDQIKSINYLTIYPTLIGILAFLPPFVLWRTGSYWVNAITTILAAIVPIIGTIVSMVGILWVYYSAPGDAPKVMRSNPLMTLPQAAKFLQMPEDEVRALVESGKLMARRFHGQYRFDREILDALRSARRQSGSH